MAGAFRSYRDLDVWRKGMDLAKEVYRLTAQFPGEERFGLVAQMPRAAVSIPSNLPEGHARSGTGEFRQFVSMALGSVAELETQVQLCQELGYLHSPDGLLEQLDRIGKMLRGLQKSLTKRKLEAPASSLQSPVSR
jgi:four helix bundle protein